MTAQDARERAREFLVAHGDEGYEDAFVAGAQWQKREDEQRIAARVALLQELFENTENVDMSYNALYVSRDLWERWLTAIGMQECPTCHGCGGCGEHETDAPFGADPCPTCEGSGVRALADSEEAGS